ncbi:MAG: thioester domain-containing protein [Clostridium sp.]|nr:thioester domain-containing protein [Clostridium sp.]
MNRLKRILSLFLVLLSLIGWTVQAMPIDPSNITKVEIKVNGEGTVTINDEDGYSKTIRNQEVFKADCTLDTDLKLIATPNEGYYISSVDGIDSEGVSDGKSKVYDVDLKENKTSITINFLEEIKEETNEEVSQPNTNDEKDEDIPKEEVNEIEIISEEQRIINQYNDGIKFEKEQIEARKKLATEKNLLDEVDGNFFLKREYLSDKSSAELMDEGVLILINSLSKEEVEQFSANVINLIPNILNIRESLIVGNRGAVTEYYQGYAHTAPMLSVDGKQAFCAMFERPDPPSGTRAYNKRQVNNEMMRKILYYGYKGPGTGNISSNWSSNQNLLMIATTQATSKANGHRSYSLGNDFYNYVSTLPSPPSGFKVYMVSTGASTQDLAFWEMQQKGSLQISKNNRFKWLV